MIRSQVIKIEVDYDFDFYESDPSDWDWSNMEKMKVNVVSWDKSIEILEE